jgi:hypothetical protein
MSSRAFLLSLAYWEPMQDKRQFAVLIVIGRQHRQIINRRHRIALAGPQSAFSV